MAANNSQLDMNHWIIRLLAFIIDYIIAGIIPVVLYSVVLSDLIHGFVGIIVVLFGLIGVFSVLYSMILEVLWNGQTLGDKIFGLQVKMANGSKLDYNKAFMRNITKIYPLFIIIDWLAAVATAGSDRRQKYFDRIAGTTVVLIGHPSASSTSPPPPPPTLQP
jgi:uncharacterized RDD family membrane protein YckC